MKVEIKMQGVRFICGCSHPSGEVPLDGEGFVICPTHGQRRYGWKSLPTDAKTGFPDFSLSGLTPWEVEQLVIFGNKTVVPAHPLNSTVADTRDNRDPELVGAEIIAKRNGNELRADWPR